MSKNRRVKDIAEYLKAVSEIKTKWPNSTLVFRGVRDKNWLLVSSAEFRLKGSRSIQDRVSDWLFLKYNEDLVEKCKMKNYNQRERRQLYDLELLADLQHQGAATCLTDFTRNALVALWFACQKSDAAGKVFVVNIADGEIFREIMHTDIKKRSIREILEFKTRKTKSEIPVEYPKFWHWRPAHLNERIPAQHSLFLFGLPSSGEMSSEEIIIESASKEQIQKELEALYDICAESLFPDFVGFASIQRANDPYSTPDIEEYIRRGGEALQRGQYSDSVEYMTKVIEISPTSAEAHYARGVSYCLKGKVDLAIKDFNEAIKLKPKFADAYLVRGSIYLRKGKVDLAIKDFNEAIKLKPKFAEAHYALGFARLVLKEWNEAKSNLTIAKDAGLDIVATFRRYNGSVSDFERIFEVKLPEAIAAMLTESEN